jgi:hypothetical protein
MITTGAVPLSIKFNGGLDTTTSPINIGNESSPNCKNVHTTLSGTLVRRNGYDDIVTATNGRVCNGVFDYWKDSITHYLITYYDKYLYKMDIGADNRLDNVLDSIVFSAQMANSTMEFEQFNDAGTNYLIMASYNRDTLQKYEGTNCSNLSSDTDMPKPKYIKQWKGYLFCANIENYESRVYYNDVSGAIIDDGDWSATKYEDIRTNDGDYITGLAVLKGRLYTFKRNSIHRWTYLGGSPLWSIKDAVNGVGAISSKSIINMTHPKYGEVLVFLAPDARFYAFDGSQAIPISSKIETENYVSEFNLSRLNRDYLQVACAVDYQYRHWYVCSVPTGATNDWTVIWDYYTDSWWVFDIDMSACAIVQSGGERNLYFGSDVSKLYRFDYGNSDDSANIAVNYDTKKFSHDNIPILKSQHYLDIQLRNVPATSINVKQKSDWATSWSDAEVKSCDGGGFILGTSKLGDTLGGPDGLYATVDLPNINNTQQIRFYSSDDDPAWQIYAADLVTSGEGYGKGS